VTTTYVAGFENSTRIRDNHFELWLAQPQAGAAQAKPTVLVLYLSPAQQGQANDIAKAIPAISKEFAVSVVSYRAVSWNFTDAIELHYFHREDEAEAQKISGKLQDVGAFYAKPRFMAVSQQIPLRYFEIWLQPR